MLEIYKNDSCFFKGFEIISIAIDRQRKYFNFGDEIAAIIEEDTYYRPVTVKR